MQTKLFVLLVMLFTHIVEDIWKLFDECHSKGVYWLMYERDAK